VVLYYLLNKLLLAAGNDLASCTLLPGAMLLPAYFTFVLDKRYAIFKVDDKGKLIATENKPMVFYILFVATVMVRCEFSLAMCLIVAQPLLKHLLGNVLSVLIHITACYSLVIGESVGWSVLQLTSLVLMTKSLQEISSMRLYPKM